MDHRTIALVGFMGSGKSTVGARIAERTGLPLVDLDARIEAAHGSIPALFAARGEAGFRELESQALREVTGPCVLATGGGTPLAPRNRAWLETHTDTVFLDVPLEVCRRRVGDGDARPLWGDADARFASRRPVYAAAWRRVDANAPPEEVTGRVLEALADPMEPVDLVPPYGVRIGHGLDGLPEALDALGPDGLIVVTDSQVGPLWAPGLLEALGHPPLLTLPAGEAQKTFATFASLVDDLLALRPSRRTVVLVLGGGVPGDVAGFAASVVARGLRVVQLPTTTLAMIDSSVGGKTAVNHPRGKNLVGTFHQPSLVWADLRTLGTLDPRHARAGLVEAVKVAATHDPVLFDLLEVAASDVLDTPGLLRSVVRQAVRAKAGVVARDPYEGGERALLNAGHTVGHALERALGYGHLLHGEAVAIGLCAETAWAVDVGRAAPRAAARLESVLEALGAPVRWPPGVAREAFVSAVLVDKKAGRDTLGVPYVSDVGHGAMATEDPESFANAILALRAPLLP